MEHSSSERGRENKQMEKNALTVFAVGSAIVFSAAIYYSYNSGQYLACYMLGGVIVFLVAFLSLIFRKKR